MRFSKPGMRPHIHGCLPGTAMVHKVQVEVKEMTTCDHFKSLAAIAEEIVSAHI